MNERCDRAGARARGCAGALADLLLEPARTVCRAGQWDALGLDGATA